MSPQIDPPVIHGSKSNKGKGKEKSLSIVKNALLNCIDRSPDTYRKYYKDLLARDNRHRGSNQTDVVQRLIIEPDFWALYALELETKAPLSLYEDPVIQLVREKILTLSNYYLSLPLEYLSLNWKENWYYGIGPNKLSVELVAQDILSRQNARYTQCKNSLTQMNRIYKKSIVFNQKLQDAGNRSLQRIEGSANENSPRSQQSHDQIAEQERKRRKLNSSLKKYIDSTINKLQRRQFVGVTAKKLLISLVNAKSLNQDRIKRLSPEEMEFLVHETQILRRRKVNGKCSVILNEFDG